MYVLFTATKVPPCNGYLYSFTHKYMWAKIGYVLKYLGILINSKTVDDLRSHSWNMSISVDDNKVLLKRTKLYFLPLFHLPH